MSEALRSLEGAGIERPTRRSRKTRAELIDAALAVLAESGMDGLTVKAVTVRADVGHGTFYHHFASTEEVLVAAIESSTRAMAEELATELADADDKAFVLIHSLGRTYRALCAHPALAWMIERPLVLSESIRNAVEPFAVRDLEALVATGEVDAALAARSFPQWQFLMLGALSRALEPGADLAVLESNLVEISLRTLAIGEARIEELVARHRAAAAEEGRR